MCNCNSNINCGCDQGMSPVVCSENELAMIIDGNCVVIDVESDEGCSPYNREDSHTDVSSGFLPTPVTIESRRFPQILDRLNEQLCYVFSPEFISKSLEVILNDAELLQLHCSITCTCDCNITYTCAAPELLEATIDNDGRVQLSWDNNEQFTDPSASISIEYSDGGSPWVTLLSGLSLSTTSFDSHTSPLSPYPFYTGTTYSFRIVKNCPDEDVLSNEIDACYVECVQPYVDSFNPMVVKFNGVGGNATQYKASLYKISPTLFTLTEQKTISASGTGLHSVTFNNVVYSDAEDYMILVQTVGESGLCTAGLYTSDNYSSVPTGCGTGFSLADDCLDITINTFNSGMLDFTISNNTNFLIQPIQSTFVEIYQGSTLIDSRTVSFSPAMSNGTGATVVNFVGSFISGPTYTIKLTTPMYVSTYQIPYTTTCTYTTSF